MKFSRSSIIGIFIALILVAASVLGVMYNSAAGANKLAKTNLDAARLSQTLVIKQKADIASQMAKATAEVSSWNNKIALLKTEIGQASISLKQTQGQFPLSAQTIEYNETLIGLAKSSNLTMTLITATEEAPGDLNIPDFAFETNIFSISVTGKVGDILNFVGKITATAGFKTGVITPVSFTIPVPLTQAVKDQMKADIRTQMIADTLASMPGSGQLDQIEIALDAMLAEKTNGTQPSAEALTKKISDVINSKLNGYLASLMAGQIAQAIDSSLADTLISLAASTFAQEIATYFVYSGTELLVPPSDLLPIFSSDTTKTNGFTFNALGVKITEAIQGIPASQITPTVTLIISDELNALVSNQIGETLSGSIDTAFAAQVAAAEMPSGQLTIGVYSFKGA